MPNMPDRTHTSARSTRCCLALLALAAVFGRADARAEIEMSAHLGQPTIATGESTYIAVSIAGIKESIQPTIVVEKGEVTGVSARLLDLGRQGLNDGNSITVVFTYRFSITGVKPGEYSLAADIKVGGETFGTEAQKLTVRPPTQAEVALEPTFSIAVGKNEIYLGEILPLQLIVSTSSLTREEPSNAFPEVESDGFVMQPLRGIYREGRDDDGRNRFYFEGNCEALKAGDLRLGPATYPLQVAFLDRSHGRASRRVFNLKSDPITIKVRPLPTEGKPASFTGTVGRFTMDIDAAPKKLRQGEPIALNLSIAGSGNLPSIREPAFTGDAHSWKLYDSKRIDSRDEQRDRRNPLAPVTNTGRVTFTRMIVPLEVAAEIPPFEFSFFDPETGQYRTLRTEPLPIEVAEDPNAKLLAPATTAQAPGDAPTKPDVPDKLPPLEDMQDILSIRDRGDQTWGGTRTPLVRSKLFWALQAPPAAALFALVCVAFNRRLKGRDRSSGWAGTYPPCAELLRQLESKSLDGRSFYRLAHQFLQARDEQVPSATAAKLQPDLAAAVTTIRERHNFLEFGAPGDGAGSRTIGQDEQQSVIRTLTSLPGHA